MKYVSFVQICQVQLCFLLSHSFSASQSSALSLSETSQPPYERVRTISYPEFLTRYERFEGNEIKLHEASGKLDLITSHSPMSLSAITILV